MARLGLQHLRFPGERYRVSITPAPPPGRKGKPRRKFETRSFSREEDRTRAELCMRAAATLPPQSARAARRLAKRLRGGVSPATLASSRWMRRVRIRVIGHTWRLVEEGPWDAADRRQVATVTLVPRCWELTPDQLAVTRAEHLMAQLRTWLNRAGAGTADGCLLVCLHGDFEPNRGVFRLHVHGVAAGGMITVFNGLRKHPELNAKLDPPGGLKKPPPRVMISRQPLSNIVYTLSYQLKSYWPSVWMGVVNSAGDVRRSRKRQRIRNPEHTQLLLWLDRHQLPQITLLMKLRVGKQGLVPTHTPARSAPNQKD